MVEVVDDFEEEFVWEGEDERVWLFGVVAMRVRRVCGRHGTTDKRRVVRWWGCWVAGELGGGILGEGVLAQGDRHDGGVMQVVIS